MGLKFTQKNLKMKTHIIQEGPPLPLFGCSDNTLQLQKGWYFTIHVNTAISKGLPGLLATLYPLS